MAVHSDLKQQMQGRQGLEAGTPLLSNQLTEVGHQGMQAWVHGQASQDSLLLLQRGAALLLHLRHSHPCAQDRHLLARLLDCCRAS